MDHEKTGRLIQKLRREKGLTQLQLAQKLHVSDKAVSKWERGMGSPDVSLLAGLSEALGAGIESLLCGELAPNEDTGGNMKKLRFYVCPACGAVLTSTGQATVSCCGKRLKPLAMAQAGPGQQLTVEEADGEYFITCGHEMTKEHFISFLAVLTGDSLLMKKLYPEWAMQARVPCTKGALLVWYCTQHGLFCQPLRPGTLPQAR